MERIRALHAEEHWSFGPNGRRSVGSEASTTTTRWRTQLIVPPARPYSPLRGLAVMARNPARWWSADMYDTGVRRVPIFGRTFVHVARPDIARTVLLEQDDAFGRSFVTQRILEPAMGGGLLTSDGEHWRRQRRLLAPVFRATALERFVPTMDRHALACRDALLEHDGSTEPVYPHTARAGLDIVVETLFGGVDIDRRSITTDIDDYLVRLGRPDPLALLGVPDAVPRPGRRRGLALVARLRARCHAALATLRASGDSLESLGLVGRLLAAIDPDTGDALDDEAIVDNVLTFIAAGHETTAAALAWTLYALAHQPELAERLAEESGRVLGDGLATADAVSLLDLHRRTLQEAMRLYPPVAAIVRTVLRPVRVGPFDLAAGDHVTIATLPMHRNPAFWPNPHAFDVSRFTPDAVGARDRFAYLPFGDGPRVCIGAGYALTEAVLVLARLTPALRFAPADGKPPEPVLSVTLRPSDGMRLRVHRSTG